MLGGYTLRSRLVTGTDTTDRAAAASGTTSAARRVSERGGGRGIGMARGVGGGRGGATQMTHVTDVTRESLAETATVEPRRESPVARVCSFLTCYY